MTWLHTALPYPRIPEWIKWKQYLLFYYIQKFNVIQNWWEEHRNGLLFHVILKRTWADSENGEKYIAHTAQARRSPESVSHRCKCAHSVVLRPTTTTTNGSKVNRPSTEDAMGKGLRASYILSFSWRYPTPTFSYFSLFSAYIIGSAKWDGGAFSAIWPGARNNNFIRKTWQVIIFVSFGLNRLVKCTKAHLRAPSSLL